MSIVGILGAAEGLIGLFRSGIELIPNENERRKLQAALEAQQIQFIALINEAQMDLNRLDAASSSRFQSWWRPALGWSCVAAFNIQYLFYPILIAVLTVNGSGVVLPELDLSAAITLLGSMLGFAGLRSFEKTRRES